MDYISFEMMGVSRSTFSPVTVNADALAVHRAEVLWERK